MLEIGVTNAQWSDCGHDGKQPCPPLSVVEARTHFGAWAIVSAPLILGLNLSDTSMMDLHWDTISNQDAIDINQDYAGFSGSLFKAAETLTDFSPCGWLERGGHCKFPTTQFWYKPLSGRDRFGSTMAVLLMNNGNEPADLTFAFTDVPGLVVQSKCDVFDVWKQKMVGSVVGGFTAPQVGSRDSVLLKMKCA